MQPMQIAFRAVQRRRPGSKNLRVAGEGDCPGLCQLLWARGLGAAFFCLLPPPIGLVMIPLPRFANPGKRRCDVAAARAVHPAPLIANIIEGDSRVLFDPAEPAPNTNAGRGDGQ
jgi:hypothetical protein